MYDKYRQLKDLPWSKAGQIWFFVNGKGYVTNTPIEQNLSSQVVHQSPDWFQEITEEGEVQEGDCGCRTCLECLEKEIKEEVPEEIQELHCLRSDIDGYSLWKINQLIGVVNSLRKELYLLKQQR